MRTFVNLICITCKTKVKSTIDGECSDCRFGPRPETANTEDLTDRLYTAQNKGKGIRLKLSEIREVIRWLNIASG